MNKITTPEFAAFKIIDKENSICITDENVFRLYPSKFKNTKTIIVKSGEENKTQATIDKIIEQLIAYKADRTTTLIGVGGGVVTDITGYVASIYMRGLNFGFVPTTLLAIVDAGIGGKNGVNFGLHKNFIGTINQPSFIKIDISFLKTLSSDEWRNGFAEIIKHACIKNARMFAQLEQNDIFFYKKSKAALQNLIQENINIKLNIVKKDVHEKGDRKLLNFGHTLGHAIETIHHLSHGEAIAIGMSYACGLSEKHVKFSQGKRVIDLLIKYELPTHLPNIDKEKVVALMMMDKKKELDLIKFILLEKIGKATVAHLKKECCNKLD